MNEQEPISPRRRLQALLAISDSDRTDAEWDELNELEISLAPGNRLDGPDPNTTNSRKPAPGRARQPRQGGNPAQAKPAQPAGANPAAPKKAFRRSPRRAPKANAPRSDAPPKGDTPA